MAKYLVSLWLLTLSVFAQAELETSIGFSQPFYLDTDLEGGDIGGYGIRFEVSGDNWYAAYDRLQDVRRREGGFIENQDFVSAGYRHRFSNVFINLGVSLHETSDVLGSAASFNVGVGYQFNRYRVTWQHWSNGGTNSVNHGFDAITITRSL